MRFQNYIRLFFLLSFSVLSQYNLIGQDPYPPVEICIDTKTAMKNDEVCVAFTVKDFVDVEGFGFQISFNSNILMAIESLRFPDPRVPQDFRNTLTAVFNQAPNGKILFNFYGDPFSLDDGTVLFELCFKVIGNPGETSPIFFNPAHQDTGIIRPEFPGGGQVVQSPFMMKNGAVTVVSSALTITRSVCDATNSPLDNNAVLEFYFAGGTPPYSYMVTPGPSGSGVLPGQRIRLENLTMGVYTIKVTDAMAVMTTLNVPISNNLPYSYTLSSKDPDCSNLPVPNGSAIITITDPGPFNADFFKYEWSNFVFNRPDNINLSNGKYYVTIIDPAGCRRYDSTEIFREPLVADFQVTKEESCPGQGDGEVELTISGGLPFAINQYEVRLNASPEGRVTSVSNIRGGFNFITVIDSLNCFANIEFDMPTKEGILIDTLLIEDISCVGQGDGKISIRARENGNSNFIFVLRRNSQIIVGGIASNDMYSNDFLIEGNYTLTVSSVGSGCIKIFSFTIGQPDPINLTNVDVINPSCMSINGNITLTPTGGAGSPYSYVWSHDPLNNTNSASGLAAGNYTVTVTDSNGCSKDSTFLLIFDGIDPAPITNPRVETPISCFGGNDGAVTVDVFPFPAPYTYKWRRFGQTTVINNQQIATSLSAGIYVVEVSNGTCTVLDTVTLPDPPGMDIVLNLVIPTCPGINDGSIGANVTGGNPNYAYQWFEAGNQTPIGINSVLAPIGAGTYELIVIDNKLCRQDTVIELLDPAKINLELLEVNQVNCFGLANGRADVLAMGGTQVNPTFNYLWSSSPADSGPLAFNLPAGRNWVIAFDNICVSDTVFFDVPTVEKLRLDPETVFTDPSCFGSTDGMISAIATGGVETGYRFRWLGVPNGDTSIIENLGAGKYYVNVLDQTGCTALDSVTLRQPDSLAVKQNPLATQLLSCRNMDNGQIGVTVTGGNPGAIQYRWNVTNQTGPILTGLSSGNYCVTATDLKGCTGTYCMELISPPPVSGRVADVAEPECFGNKTELCIDFISGGTGSSYTYQVNQGQRFPLDSCVSLFAGTYTINLIDSAGCFIDTVIVIDQPDPITVDLPESIEVLLGEKSDIIIAQVQSAFGVNTIEWIPFDSEVIECVTPTCEAVIFSPINTQTYQVLVTDLNNCTAIGQIEVVVKDVRNVFFPNIFAPKQEGARDGFNSFFNVAVGPGVTEIISFEIFDRWGNKVFSKFNYMPDGSFSDGWDGTFRGQLLGSAVFVYRAMVRFSDGKEIPYTGSVTLVR